ncbi:MAG: tyrosine-type recombinase/integrase [Bacteroidia bacterium]|jgi:integrase/recombinase XerC
MIETFLDYLRYERRFSNHTVIAYRNDLTQLQQFVQSDSPESELTSLTAPEIRVWLVKLMEDGLDARSVNRKITALKTFYKFALKSHWIQINPMLKVVSPKVSKKLPVYVEAERLDLLLDKVEFPHNFEGGRDHLILELLYGTGMRRAELLDLKIDDIDFRLGQIKVTGKRNKQRIIPLFDALSDALSKYLEIRRTLVSNHDFLLCDEKGERLYPEKIYRIVKKYLSLVSTQTKRSPHTLRHSFATEMLNKGADLNSIKEILGHANLSATQVYTHNSIEKLRAIYKKAHPRGD